MPNDILIVVIKELEFYVLVALNFITTNYKIKYEHSESVFNFMTPHVCLCVCVCVCLVYICESRYTNGTVSVWRSEEDTFMELIPSFLLFMGSKAQTQVPEPPAAFHG